MRHPSLSSLLLAAALAAGCTATPRTGTTPTTKPTRTSASTEPGVPLLATLRAPAVGEASQLTGKVKLRLDPTGLISDMGGGIISDHAAGIISNNSGALISDGGGSIISDHAAGIVSNNSSGLTSKVKRQLLDAPVPAVFLLADAQIGFFDAAGAQLVGADGKPITAVSDKEGNYKLSSILPRQNLVMRIKLWNGGELSALLPAADGGAREQALSTATSLGASYVLERYIKGKQAVFDRLPESEATRLERELDAAETRLKTAPEYKAAALSSFLDELRGHEPAVDKSLSDVAAILLGQQSIGDGRPAMQVALGNPQALLALPGGGFMVGESFFGRIRRVATDGTIETFADVAYGEVSANFPSLVALVRAEDGTIYVAQEYTARVSRIPPGSKSALPFAGNGLAVRGAVGGQAVDSTLSPRSLELQPDGTVLIGEGNMSDDDTKPPRLLAVGSDGVLKLLDAGEARGRGSIVGLGNGPDGVIYMLQASLDRQGPGTLYKRAADGTVTPVKADLETGLYSAMQAKPDGTVYVSETRARRVVEIAPDGSSRVVPGTSGLREPGALELAPDGTLLVADTATGLVHALLPDGRWEVRAGVQAKIQSGDATAIALNAPGSAVFDDQGRLIIGEGGGNTIKRLDGETLEAIAGAGRGYAGDGGPAIDALIELPTGVVAHEGKLYFHDNANAAIRAFTPGGTIETVVGGNKPGAPDPRPGQPVDARQVRITGGMGIAVGPDGLLYWTESLRRQVMRLKDGKVECVAGQAGAAQAIETSAEIGDGGPALDASLSFPLGLAFGPDGALYIADTGHCRIRKVEGIAQGKATISTFAGLPPLEFFAKHGGEVPNEEGLQAQEVGVMTPGPLSFDAAGNLYIGELGTADLSLLEPIVGPAIATLPLPPFPARVRKIAPDGKVTTVAGPGGPYFNDVKALDRLVLPTGLAVDPKGRLVIVDGGANLIRFLPAGRF